MTRRLRYQVAVSLDGFIAGPGGEADWIVMDPSIDFGALFQEFDTVVMGRKTYDVVLTLGGYGALPGSDVMVFSRTLAPATRPDVRIVRDDPCEVVAKLKATAGRDIWLFGGGELFRTLLDAGLVDTVEVAVMPVLLGSGVPLMPPGNRQQLVLVDQQSLPASGIVALSYLVAGSESSGAPIRYTARKKSSKKRRLTRGSSVEAPRRMPSKKRLRSRPGTGIADVNTQSSRTPTVVPQARRVTTCHSTA